MSTSTSNDAILAASAIGNHAIADVLDRVGDLLDAQHANPFRVRAYRRAAHVVRTLPEPIAGVLERGGARELEQIEGIGARLASAIEEIVHTGRLSLLDRLEGQVSPEDRFATVPGIGDELAHRIHDTLHLETLEDLEAAAHDGRLDKVPGFGPRRVRGVREYLSSVLGRGTLRRKRDRRPPPVGTLLELDDQYRRLAGADKLRKIAPRRFNPTGRAWLPVWHPERDGWHFTVLYSNTGRAHDLDKIGDWVVVYYEHDGVESQATVVTEWHGELAGRRVVRGREAECRAYYHRPVDPDVRLWARRVLAGLAA